METVGCLGGAAPAQLKKKRVGGVTPKVEITDSIEVQ